MIGEFAIKHVEFTNKQIEKIREKLLNNSKNNNNNSIKRVDVIFGGDFNFSSQSLSFSYITNKLIPSKHLDNKKGKNT